MIKYNHQQVTGIKNNRFERLLLLLLFSITLMTIAACQQAKPDGTIEADPAPTAEENTPASTLTATQTAEIIPAATMTTAPPIDPVPLATLDDSSPLPGETAPYMAVVNDFLVALRDGMTGADSELYFSPDLQAAINDGRPLPAVVGIRDAYPDFELTDLSDSNLISGAIVMAQLNFDVPTFTIYRLVELEGSWRINNIGQHNLVRSGSIDLITAEVTIINYYQALANDELNEALALLTNEAKETFTADALAPFASGLRRVTVTTLQPIQASENQLLFYVRLYATPNEAQPGPWREGDNPRWITMQRSNDAWYISNIVNSPILADITSWQRVNILPIDMTLDIPASWTRVGLEWAWSPNSDGAPAIGIRWAELGEFGGDETLLPRNRRSLDEQPLDLGWAQGTQYIFEQIGGIGEAPLSAEVHLIMRTGRRAYDFYAVANNVEELRQLQPILQRMVAAVVIHDSAASAFHSIESASAFLATLITDSTGNSSLPYIAENMLIAGSDYQSLLDLLMVTDPFQSFQVSWLENSPTGEAIIAATLYYPNQPLARRLLTLERDTAGQWRITQIEARAE